MRKILLLLILLITASGCSFSVGIGDDSNKSEKDKGNLSLQVTKADKDAGVTIENNEIYQELDKMIVENPLKGEANDFSLYIVDILESDTGEKKLLLMGINRLDMTIQDIVFDFTLGNKDDEYVWEEIPLTLPEQEFGAIKVDKAFPIFLTITDKQAELVKSLTTDDQVFKISNFKYESVE